MAGAGGDCHRSVECGLCVVCGILTGVNIVGGDCHRSVNVGCVWSVEF